MGSSSRERANQTPFPKGVAKPAQRALAAAGAFSLDDVTRFSENELNDMHGMGPKAIRIMKEEMAKQGKHLKK